MYTELNGGAVVTPYPQIERARAALARGIQFYTTMGRAASEQTPLLYAATDDVFYEGKAGDQKDLLPPRLTIQEAQQLVERVQRSAYARDHWPKFFAAQSVRVDNDYSQMKRGWPFSSFSGAFTDPTGTIREGKPVHIGMTPNWAQSIPALLHEVGHAIYFYEAGMDAYKREVIEWNGHGPEFAKLNLEVLREFLSPEAATQLQNAYDYAGVKR